jgi:hypothetical protein
MNIYRRRVVAATAAVVALVATALVVVPAVATPPSPEVTTTPIGMGRFADIDTNVKTDVNPGAPTKFWKARIMTKRSSNLYVLENTIPPGKTFGWHSHPGPSLVIVKSGTATIYLAADPTCRPMWSRPGPASSTRATTSTWSATRATSTW